MDFRKLSNWTIRLLHLQIAISVIGIISGTMEHEVLRDMQDGNFDSEAEMMRAAEASDLRQTIVAVFQALIFIVSGIWILRWIYVACSNARDLAVDPMKFSPGWSVGWYFIPVLTLWKPYQAMKEIWRVSANPRHPDIVPDSRLLVAWWFFFIVASLSENAAFRVSLRAEELGELIAVNLLTRVSDVVSIPLAIIFMLVVHRIDDNQELARGAMKLREPENAASVTT